MNNNLLTERGLRDVFETTGYINIGTPDNPLDYNFKPAIRSSERGKQFASAPLKHGKVPEVLFEGGWTWVSDGDQFKDHFHYADTQPERFKGFLDSDFSKRDEFSNIFRTEQYREQLKMESKHAKRTTESNAKKIAQLLRKYEIDKPRRTRFDGPQHLYDINRDAVTPHCMRCHKDTYFCPHRAAYSTNNTHLDKEKGGWTTASEEIGRTAKQFSYAKPQYANKPIIKDTFYRRTNIFFPSKTRTNFLNQAIIA